MISQGVIPQEMIPQGMIPQENDPLGPNGQGRGSWFLAVLGSNPPPPLGPNCDQGDQMCCEADFGSRIKILGHPLGQSASFFEIYPFRLGSVWGPLGNRPPGDQGPGTRDQVTHKAALCSLVRALGAEGF